MVTFSYKIAGQSSVTSGLNINLTIGMKEGHVNGVPYTLDAEPFINAEAGRTLVPARFVSEALGAEVGWNPETRKVTINDGKKEIILTIGSTAVQVNGEKQIIDCAPAILPPGRTFVPLRFVSETLETEVVFDSSNSQIIITR